MDLGWERVIQPSIRAVLFVLCCTGLALSPHPVLSQCEVSPHWSARSVGGGLFLTNDDYRGKATQLEELRGRLKARGLGDIRLVIVNSRSAAHAGMALQAAGGMIPVLQDNPLTGYSIWDKMGAVKDDILVFDRCGRLTFHVIMPWSMLTYPYVKAALLSTFHDEPCGPCNDTTMSHYEQEHQHQQHLEGKDESSHVNASYAERLLLHPSGQLIDESQLMSSFSTSTSPNNGTIEEDVETSVMAPPTKSQEENRTTSTLEGEAGRLGNIYLHETTTRETGEDQDEMDDNEGMPIRIIMRYPHSHQDSKGNVERQDYLVMNTGDPSYHGHLLDPGDNKEERTYANDQHRNAIRREDSSEDSTVRRRPLHDYPLWRNTWDVRRNRTNSMRGENMVRKRVEEDIREGGVHLGDAGESSDEVAQEGADGEGAIAKQKMIEHYRKLLPWVNYSL